MQMIRNNLFPLLMLAGAMSAQAGRPLLTEDADVLAPQACELEWLAARQRQADVPSTQAWGSQLGCGFGAQSPAALGIGRSAGVQTLQLGGKTALLVREATAPGLTLAWGVQAQRAEGGRLQHDSSYLNLVWSQALLDGLTGHANLGWSHSRLAGLDTRSWNVALEYAATAHVDVLGEWVGDDRSKPWLALGLRWAAGPDWSLHAALAQQAERPRIRLLSLGVKLAF